MRSRLALAATFAVAWLAVLAPVALAQVEPHDNGEGFLGETDDRIVTFFSLGVVVFFVVVVIVGTLIQQRLERRKEEQKAARLHQRAGW
jgi:hypothetical protein